MPQQTKPFAAMKIKMQKWTSKDKNVSPIFCAEVDGHPEAWAKGRTIRETIGHLVLVHNSVLGIELKRLPDGIIPSDKT